MPQLMCPDAFLLPSVIITGASPKSMGAEVLRVLAPYANLIVITGRSAQR